MFIFTQRRQILLTGPKQAKGTEKTDCAHRTKGSVLTGLKEQRRRTLLTEHTDKRGREDRSYSQDMQTKGAEETDFTHEANTGQRSRDTDQRGRGDTLRMRHRIKEH